MPGGVVFASRSGVWGGGMAFFDRALPGIAACRAYLIMADQFGDIAAQERRRPPGGYNATRVARYLVAAPGIGGAWTEEQIASVAASVNTEL